MDSEPQPGEPNRAFAQGRWISLPPNIKGAIFITAAAFFFVIMTMLIRFVSSDISVFQILFVRQVVMSLSVLPVIFRSFPQALKTNHPWFHVARVAIAVGAMYCGFTAVRHIPLADATALGFAKSFFITILAIVFLSETVGARRWGATIVGFIGVLIVLDPSSDAINFYGLMAVAGAAGASMVMIIIRFLTRFDRPVTIVAYQAVSVGILVTPPAIMLWTPPSVTDLATMIAIGLVSIVAQSLNIHAFRAGEATFLAALDYSRLLWAVLLGFLIFSEIPSPATMLGASIVIAASIYTVHREARRGKALARSHAGRGFTND